MAEPEPSRLGPAFLVAVGALWLTLTGLCTFSFSSEGQYGGLWPIGLWFMSIGVLPLAIGLRAFLPPKVLGWGLCAIACAWLLFGVEWLAAAVIDAARHGGLDGEGIGFMTVLWVIFQVPGAFMLWGGVATLRGPGKAAATSESTFD